MKLLLITLLPLTIACGDVASEEKQADSASDDTVDDGLCPTPEEDSCQTEELYAECQAELADCDDALFPVGDCPGSSSSYDSWECP